jgi:hypothetical protein
MWQESLETQGNQTNVLKGLRRVLRQDVRDTRRSKKSEMGRITMTKKDLLEAIEDMPMDAKILIKVDAFTFEPTSDVGLNEELNEIVIC